MFDRENTGHQLVDGWIIYNCGIVNIPFHIYRIWGLRWRLKALLIRILFTGLALLLDCSSWLHISSREDILD